MTDRDEGLEAAFPSGIWLPLGSHGVMVAVSDQIGVFDADKRQLAGLLAATAEAALDRVEQEKRRRRREAQLEGLVEATGSCSERRRYERSVIPWSRRPNRRSASRLR
ncbi:hypothetical protein ACFQMM_02915 [Saliphagus sp. GCM10025308]